MISGSIDQVSKRLRFENRMAGGLVEVERLYNEMEAAYLQLFAYLVLQIEQAGIEVDSTEPKRENP